MKTQSESPPAAGRAQLLEANEFALVAASFRELLPLAGPLEPHLRGVVESSLGHPGSLFRAQLVFAGARRRGMAAEPARELAVAIEYFHTASLLFDDLPAMDDARERRGFPCAHVRYGEAAAMLGALALVNQGYALLWRVLGALPRGRAARAAQLVNECLGLYGILDGQARDLHFRFSPRGEADVLAVARGKTVTLIRLTLVLPALAGGARKAELAELEKLAAAWGHAYQIADDFKDLLMNDDETGKSVRRDGQLGRPNLPMAIGADEAFARLEDWLRQSADAVARLGGQPELERLQQVLEDEAGEVAERMAPAARRSCA